MTTMKPDHHSAPELAAPMDELPRIFEREGLRPPPVPEELMSCWHSFGPHVLSSKPIDTSPYDLGYFLSQYEESSEADSLCVVGFDGYGTNSWAVHFYVVVDGLGLFVQMYWGGAYMDHQLGGARIEEVFAWSGRMISKWRRAFRAGQTAKLGRLEICATELGESGWRLLDRSAGSQRVSWNSSLGMKATTESLLDRILLE